VVGRVGAGVCGQCKGGVGWGLRRMSSVCVESLFVCVVCDFMLWHDVVESRVCSPAVLAVGACFIPSSFQFIVLGERSSGDVEI